jgi:hypothetical protein
MVEDTLAFLRSFPLSRDAVDAIAAYPAHTELVLGLVLLCALVLVAGLCLWLVARTVKRIREVAVHAITPRLIRPPAFQVAERVEPRIPGLQEVSTEDREPPAHGDPLSQGLADQSCRSAQGEANAPRGHVPEQIAGKLPDSEPTIGVTNGVQTTLAEQIAAKLKEIEAAMGAVKPPV